MPEPEGILAPYRVLYLTGELGPLCAKILADLGADVLKVEPPTGDPSRWRGPFPGDRPDPEQSLSWAAWNVNKRSVTLDLSLPAGRDGLRRRAREADFLIESFPPGELDGLGLGYPALAEENPRLIVTSITPFGQTGPYSKYRASDLELMAVAGCMSLTGEPSGPRCGFLSPRPRRGRACTPPPAHCSRCTIVPSPARASTWTSPRSP